MAIKISNLSKSYKRNIVLDNLNLHIKEGSLFGLLGPNGAGKTTLISILNFLVSQDSGDVEILGYDIKTDQKLIKSFCSYVPQTYAFYPKLTAYENLEFFGALYGLKNKKLKDMIDYSMEVTSLDNYTNKQAWTYSGGLKRRLNIAVGLLNNPQILYLDEPTVGIDPQSRKYILDVIKNINKQNNTTIVYTSHYMEEVEYLCDEIAILDNSKIIIQKNKEELLYKNRFIKIEFENNQTKIVDTKNGYEDLALAISNAKDSNLKIKNIAFEQNSLEDMFLNITKQDLRD